MFDGGQGGGSRPRKLVYHLLANFPTKTLRLLLVCLCVWWAVAVMAGVPMLFGDSGSVGADRGLGGAVGPLEGDRGLESPGWPVREGVLVVQVRGARVLGFGAMTYRHIGRRVGSCPWCGLARPSGLVRQTISDGGIVWRLWNCHPPLGIFAFSKRTEKIWSPPKATASFIFRAKWVQGRKPVLLILAAASALVPWKQIQ